jgi:hypothetical protein
LPPLQLQPRIFSHQMSSISAVAVPAGSALSEGPEGQSSKVRRWAVPFSEVPLRYIKNTFAYRARQEL